MLEPAPKVATIASATSSNDSKNSMSRMPSAPTKKSSGVVPTVKRSRMPPEL